MSDDNNSNNNVKSMFKVGTITVLIVGILALIVVKIVFNNIYNKIDNDTLKQNETKEEVIKNENTNTEVNLTDERVIKALSDFNSIYINNDRLYNNFNIKSINKTELVITALNQLDSSKKQSLCDENSSTINVSIDEINSALSNVVLNNKLTINDIKTAINSDDGFVNIDIAKVDERLFSDYSIKFNNNNLNIYTDCGKIGLYDSIITKLTKISFEDDKLYIYEKVAFGKLADRQDITAYDYFSDYNTTKLVETVLYDKEDLTWDLYNEYKLTFKKVNDKYYFESMNKGE